jgi:hypothetical protein
MPSYNPWRNPSERSHGIVIRCIRIVHAESGANLCYWPFTAGRRCCAHGVRRHTKLCDAWDAKLRT